MTSRVTRPDNGVPVGTSKALARTRSTHLHAIPPGPAVDVADRPGILEHLIQAIVAMQSGQDPAAVARAFETAIQDALARDEPGARKMLAAAIPLLVDAARAVRSGADAPAGMSADGFDGASTGDHSPIERLIHALGVSTVVGVCVYDSNGVVLAINDRLRDMIGIPGGHAVGKKLRALLPGLPAGALAPGRRTEHVVRRPADEISLVIESIDIPDRADGRHRGLCLVDDVTDRRAVEHARQNSEERIQALVQNSSDVIAIVSEAGEFEYVSESIERILGYVPASLIGGTVLDMVPEEARERLSRVFEGVLETPRGATQTSSRVAHVDGSWRWMEIDLTNLADVPSVGGVVITARDVTRRKAFEQQLERLAYYDTLTGLPNRAHFRDRLDDAVRGAVSAESSVAVIFLDLDRFKMINDRYGHDAGDSALVAVSQRILDTLRPGEMVARLGGDEFAVLVEPATSQRALDAANRVLNALTQRFPGQHRFYSIEGSAGVAVSSPGLDEPSELLRAADIALYQAKAIGGGVAALFEPGMDVAAIGRADLERALQLALDLDEMEPWFQPEIDISTNTVTSLELLMRWRRRDGHVEAPDAFLDVATELGIITPLGLGILRRACRQVMAWSAASPRPIRISFNVSERDLSQPGYPQRIADILDETGLSPAQLGIEIDDRVFHHRSPELDRFVRAIREMGLELIVDGVGGGHASWNQIQRLRPDRLKIARTAPGETANAEVDRIILQSVTAMAHILQIPVTVVGLSGQDHHDRALAAGCQRGQGFLVSPPVAGPDVPALLARLAGSPGA